MSDASSPDETALPTRTGLPDALQALVDGFSRSSWEDRENLDELTRFWLDRHIMFRQLLTRIDAISRHLIDRNIDPDDFARQLSRYGSLFINQLHGHHGIEDHHYFPLLVARDKRLRPAFALLDSDHQCLDENLHAFADLANQVLAGTHRVEAAGRFQHKVTELEQLLNRHLLDEEDIVVPTILKYGPVGL